MPSSHLAASAYGHCLVMVGDDATAAALAVVALRRGGRRLAPVLGHARHQALAYLAAHPAPAPVVPADAGPAEVAAALAASRPPVERAVLDLSGRYHLGPAGLGVALRMSPAAAAARVAAVARTWDAVLDPALLAWLGPGECVGLAEVLAGYGGGDVSGLLEAGAQAGAHTAGCEPCRDRLRAMASVRLLTTKAPLPVPPPSVVAAAGSGRLQPPTLPPPLDPPARRWFRRAPVAAAVVAGLGALAAVGTAVAGREDGARLRQSAVEELTRVAPAAGSLHLTPAVLDLPGGQLVVTNDSPVGVAWEASADVTWLEVTPERGRLEPGQARALAVRVLDTAPEGEVRAAVRVVGNDGSASASMVTGAVEHPPDLGVDADGCQVVAAVEDEGDVRLSLHWRDATGEHGAPMEERTNAWTGALPPARPLTWWVRAVDGRGNQARTADVTVPAGC